MEYNLLFGNGFDFVKGGKLPGLYGGHTRYGGHIIKFSFQKVKLGTYHIKTRIVSFLLKKMTLKISFQLCWGS